MSSLSVDVKSEKYDFKSFLRQPSKYVKLYCLITQGYEPKDIYAFHIADACLWYFGGSIACSKIKGDLQILYFESPKYTHYAVIYKDIALLKLGDKIIKCTFDNKIDKHKEILSVINSVSSETFELKVVNYYNLKDPVLTERLMKGETINLEGASTPIL